MGTWVLQKYPYRVRFEYGYDWGCTQYFFFLKKKLGTAGCGLSMAECGWVWLEYAGYTKLPRFAFFFFLSQNRTLPTPVLCPS